MERANGPTAAISIDDGAPCVPVRVVADSFGLALAITTDAVVLTSFVLADNAQVGSPAVQLVVVQEDDLVSFWCGQDLAVEVAESVLAIDLAMANSVALPAITFGPVAPLELGKKRKVAVVNESDLILREGNF